MSCFTVCLWSRRGDQGVRRRVLSVAEPPTISPWRVPALEGPWRWLEDVTYWPSTYSASCRIHTHTHTRTYVHTRTSSLTLCFSQNGTKSLFNNLIPSLPQPGRRPRRLPSLLPVPPTRDWPAPPRPLPFLGERAGPAGLLGDAAVT